MSVVKHGRRKDQCGISGHWFGLFPNIILVVALLTVIMWQDIYEVIHARITG